MQVELATGDHAVASGIRGSRYRPLLLALAICLAAATTSFSIAWIYYSSRPGAPVEVGMDTEQVSTGLRVMTVWRDSPAQRAGLRVGDIILALNDQSVAPPNNGLNMVDALWSRSHPGETVHFTVHREGEATPILISPVFRHPVGSGDSSLARRGASYFLLSYPLVFLVVGMAVLFLRLEDRNAWILALMFTGFISLAPAPEVIGAPDRLQQIFSSYSEIVKAPLGALFYFFFAVFPTRSPIDRKLPWLKWLLLVISVCLRWGDIPNGRTEPLPFLLHLFSRRTLGQARMVDGYGSVLLGFASLVLNAINVTRVEDRRKLKVMLWGTLVGVTPAVAIGFFYDLVGRHIPFWLVFTQAIFLFIFPLSFAYAVVKHRVMDIPVLLRRSARYLLVERGFAILMLLVSVGLTLWFGQAFSRRFSAGSKAAIPIGATFGVLLISGATQVHRRVRTRLDRAFFRSAYDAQQILENLAAKTLAVTDREGLAHLLHQHIQDALHPMPLFVYLLAGDGRLHPYAGNPPPEALTLLPAAAGLNRLAGRTEPLELDPATLRGTQMEPLHAECLVPIRGSADSGLQGVIVLGPRLSEEPYSAGDRRLLASVASQAGIAMRSISMAEKMAESMEAERRSEQEMQIARQVQSRLLPQQAPSLPTLECAGKCIQTRAVGGDYYDFLDFGAGKLGLVLADISGKGISAALLMANLQANLRSQYALALEDLPRLLHSVNHLFYKNTENNHYATMFFAVYDDRSRLLRYVNCGHNPPLLLRENGDVEWLPATATVLGLFEEWECSVAERQLGAGDVLVIYTDGISEAAPSEESEEFGDERLIRSVRTHQSKSANEMLEAIIAEVQSFSQGEQADDMTLIVARCR
ncbi:MAG: SpoIIE family protein phosphatase [Candidatus Korobacteraceae bacterium]|jgi:sigma-B regulation protein RsbU (phosphoserine phosphatase)